MVDALRRVLRSTGSQRRLHLEALGTVARIRLALWLHRPVSVLTTVERRAQQAIQSSLPSSHEPGQIGRAVTRVSRYVPGATCLPQALAARELLARSGYPSRVRIGVGRDEDARFEAHAWTEHDGIPVVGGAGSSRFTPLPDLEQALERFHV